MAKLTPNPCHQCSLNHFKLTKAWNNKYYCSPCFKWNLEAEQSGIASCYRYTLITCQECGQCATCQKRKGLSDYSTTDLLTEIINRPDYEALITWEDDWLQRRIEEIIYELKLSEGLTIEQIKTQVNVDIQKPLSHRKYSRGT